MLGFSNDGGSYAGETLGQVKAHGLVETEALHSRGGHSQELPFTKAKIVAVRLGIAAMATSIPGVSQPAASPLLQV